MRHKVLNHDKKIIKKKPFKKKKTKDYKSNTDISANKSITKGNENEADKKEE